jgi:hypothetical protein
MSSQNEDYRQPVDASLGMPAEEEVRSYYSEASEPGAVLSALVQVALHRKRVRWLLVASLIVAVMLLILLRPASVPWSLHLAAIAIASVALIRLWYMTPAGMAPGRWRPYEPASIQKYATATAIGRLSEALRYHEKDVVSQAEAALTALLPNLKTSDGVLLNAEQRTCLYHVLQVKNISGKSDLLVEILAALTRIGDVQALPAIRALASCQVDSSSGRRVKTAAETSLQTLSEIAALNDPHESLLRPSEAAIGAPDTLLRPILVNDGSPETLVRPAAFVPDDSPDELLRPQSPEEPNH